MTRISRRSILAFGLVAGVLPSAAVAADKPKEIRIDLPVDAHIPDTYVNSERLRLEIYRKLAEFSKDDREYASGHEWLQ